MQQADTIAFCEHSATLLKLVVAWLSCWTITIWPCTRIRFKALKLECWIQGQTTTLSRFDHQYQPLNFSLYTLQNVVHCYCRECRCHYNGTANSTPGQCQPDTCQQETNDWLEVRVCVSFGNLSWNPFKLVTDRCLCKKEHKGVHGLG